VSDILDRKGKSNRGSLMDDFLQERGLIDGNVEIPLE